MQHDAQGCSAGAELVLRQNILGEIERLLLGKMDFSTLIWLDRYAFSSNREAFAIA